MTAALAQEVCRRLESDRYAWLTTVARSGQPVPRLVGFVFDGTDLTVYSMPDAAKVRHIIANPRVSLSLDCEGNGNRGVAVGGKARVDAVGTNPLDDERYQAKYGEYAKGMGIAEDFLSAFSVRLKISIDRVWTALPVDQV
jgi:PPOX class probable F420-dependent enzyme